MRKKIPVLLLCLLFALGALGCGENTPPVKEPPAQEKGVEALVDTKFDYGFRLFGPDSRFHQTIPWAMFQSDDAIDDPIWKLGTWGCFVNYWLDSETTFIEGANTYTYPARPLTVTESDGWRTIENGTTTVSLSQNGSIRLAQNSGMEYGVTPAYTDAPRASLPRRDGEAWPHLLIEQSIPNNMRLSQMEKAEVSIKFTVDRCQAAAGVTQNSNMHAAQFQWILAVRCDDPQKASYGKYYWFSLPLYDSRETDSKGGMFADSGKEDATDSLIYTTASTFMLGEVGQVGKTYDVTVDALPELKKAFATAQSKGWFGDCTLDDMRIENTNIGWELPGVFDACVQIDKLSMRYFKKEANV